MDFERLQGERVRGICDEAGKWSLRPMFRRRGNGRPLLMSFAPKIRLEGKAGVLNSELGIEHLRPGVEDGVWISAVRESVEDA
jgi:hypothetical protein